jgi:hypothetical protein
LQRARSGLHKMAADILSRLPLHEAVVAAWPLACGASVAKRTKALDLNAGKLRVQVPDAGWRVQLSDFSAQYASTLNAIVRNRAVEKIEYVLKAEPTSASELKNY